MWYQRFDTYLLGLGLPGRKVNLHVYLKKTTYQFIYVVLYLNDILLTRNNKEIIKYVQDPLSSNFDMKYLGATKKRMGIEIKRDKTNRKLWLNKEKYIETMLKRFNMKKHKSIKVLSYVGENLSSHKCLKT